MVRNNLGQSLICCEVIQNHSKWLKKMSENIPNWPEMVSKWLFDPNWSEIVQRSPNSMMNPLKGKKMGVTREKTGI